MGITIVSHDTEQKTRADSSPGRKVYVRDVTYYGASLAQLGALTDLSTKCEQFISYECRDSRLLAGGTSWWRSRDGKKMNYWGGAPPGSKMCACGVTKTCQRKRKCNCDANSATKTLKDEGMLSEKAYLPVTQLRFGDVQGDEEYGYHILGKLRCTGYPPCKFDPCENGGTCVALQNQYTCTCKQGFTGKRCKTGEWWDNPTTPLILRHSRHSSVRLKYCFDRLEYSLT